MGKSKKELYKWVEDAWYGLGDISKLKITNPLLNRSQADIQNPELFYGRFLINPEYFAFTCKILLNLTIIPVQAAILQELWLRPFPMFIASRGFSKSWCLAVYSLLKCILQPNSKIVIVGAAFRQAKVIFEYMENIWNNAPILQSVCDHKSGPRHDVDRHMMRINDSIAIAIPLGTGEKIRGLRATTIISDEFNCLDANTLVETDRGLIRIGDEHFDNMNFKLVTGDKVLPLEQPVKYIKTRKCDVYQVKFRNGYILKCSLNHKVMTNNGWKKPLELHKGDFVECENYYKFPKKSPNGMDEKLAWLMGILISEGSINNKSLIAITTTNKNLADKLVKEFGFKCNIRSAHIDRRGWNCRLAYQLHLTNKALRNTLYEYGLEYTTAHHKKIPWSILTSSKAVVYAFLEGLFEGDGSCFTYKYKKVSNYLGVAYYSVSETLCRDVQVLLYKLGYDAYINKRKSHISDNDQWFIRLNGLDAYNFANKMNIERFIVALSNCYISKTPSNVTFDKSRNKWKINIKYLGRKIQKRFITKEEALATVTEIKSRKKYREVVSVKKLDEQEILYDYHLPKTHSFYGGGIRNHNSIPPDIYETVVAGFAVVSSDPVTSMQEAARRKAMTKLGIWTADSEKKYQLRGGNQAILSGTAGYDFQHFAKYWKRYCAIVRSKGDKRKLAEILETTADDIPSNFNWRDYSVIRIPYKLIPEAFMEEKHIARARATMHSGIFDMEYNACVNSTTLIITTEGVKPIIDVQIGDKVLTHKGRFKRVIKKTYRKHDNDIISYKTYGCFTESLVTPNHPFYHNGNFIPLADIIESTQLVNVQDISNVSQLDLTNVCQDYIRRDDYIYARSSKNTLNNTDIKYILDKYQQGDTQTSLGKRFNLCTSAISSIIKQKKPKASINVKVDLDYDFGLCMGYYASEGSCGAKNKMVNFALDGHKNIIFTKYINELSMAILNTFGIKPKIYKQTPSVASVCINSKLCVQVFKYICPGVCYDKIIRHNILFSTKEFMKGFIVGMMNGDGHIRHNLCTLQLTNLNMINQVRMVLSYFGVSASILKPKYAEYKYMKGKRVKLTQPYKLNIYGQNFKTFMQIFYNQDITNLLHPTQAKIVNQNDHTNLALKDMVSLPYNDYVYNLEVEEDNSYSTLNSTIHNCFTADSDGFFKRTLVESCVTSDIKPIKLGLDDIWFDASIHGSSAYRYVYGIDPASERDNFSIVVLELRKDHTRIVYAWSTNRSNFKERVRVGLSDKLDFYGFCCRKIRDLMKTFPCEAIALDGQGGGVAIEEGLHDPDKMEEGEIPIWPIIEEKEKDTDIFPGKHILHICQFANGEWTKNANHGMRKDFEDKVLLFPRFDPLTLELSAHDDGLRQQAFERAQGKGSSTKKFNVYDTLEDCVMELESLKDELCTITVTRTGTGVNSRDRWDTPELKLPNGKKGRDRKDRYSALVMANMVARQIGRAPTPVEYESIGGFTKDIDKGQHGQMYNGPDWFVRGMNEGTVFGVVRR